jgi:hypothetical protein
LCCLEQLIYEASSRESKQIFEESIDAYDPGAASALADFWTDPVRSAFFGCVMTTTMAYRYRNLFISNKTFKTLPVEFIKQAGSS